MREIAVGTIGSLAASVALTAMGLLSRRVAHGEYPGDLLIKALVVGLYLILFAGGVFILTAKYASLLEPQRRIYRFGKWPKIMAVVVLVIGLVLVGWSFVPYSLPPLKVRVINHTPYSVLLSDEADFFIKVPDSAESSLSAGAGACQLSWLETPTQRDKPILVSKDNSVNLVCRIVNPVRYRRWFRSENMKLDVWLHKDDGTNVMGTLAFNRNSVENYWITFELK
jgi:hypothetical protein